MRGAMVAGGSPTVTKLRAPGAAFHRGREFRGVFLPVCVRQTATRRCLGRTIFRVPGGAFQQGVAKQASQFEIHLHPVHACLGREALFQFLTPSSQLTKSSMSGQKALVDRVTRYLPGV